MFGYLQQSTGATVTVGPFVDKTDAVSEEAALAGTMTVKVAKNGGSLAARDSSDAIAYDTDGYYQVPLSTTDTNTLGRLTLAVSDPATHLHVREYYQILNASAYEMLCGTTGGAEVKTFSSAALLELLQTDTGETSASTGSVVELAQGNATGNVTVADFTSAALLKLIQEDTGETSASTGSVAKIAQGASGLDSATVEAACEAGMIDLGYTSALSTKLDILSAPAGSGAITEVVTVTDNLSNPVDGVEVWLTSDEAGNNIVAGTLVTDASGEVTFYLDAGTYYVWLQKSGGEFGTVPKTLIVS